MSSTNISSLYSVLFVIGQKLAFGFALIYVIFGVTGCFLNILLFSRRQFRTISCCIYFLAASVSMFIQLSFVGGTYIYSAYYLSPLYYSAPFCKLWYYLTQANGNVFRWMLVAACLDRYAVSSSNARIRRFGSICIARRVIVVLVFIWFVLVIPFLFLYDMRSGNCIILYGSVGAFYVGLFTIINLYASPVSIMIICVFLIRRNLANKRERRRQMDTNQQHIKNDREYLQHKRDQQTLAMLFAQVVIYIITTTPWVICVIYNAISLNVSNKSTDRLVIEDFMLFVTSLIIFLFPTMSFYLYTLTSNMFRKELFIMFRSVLCFKYFINTNQIKPMVTNVPMRNLNTA